ncbi:hypothetical protein [Taibaiella chishuiensis]|uniref:Uncharacterized protein n=1 Tax=Taibaiella chishuiensis TaxID=1434707 RepID=A0A2P8D0K1_9BACT|nr:hypothetical protein [Taibaiella chishuiensis]PSK90741.1 hypothetical protein B0I18_107151 [Taibaiella chishuiensis]
MKKVKLMFALLALGFGQQAMAQTCNCTANNLYAVEYPSTGNTQTGSANYNFSLPVSAITSGNNIHLWFPKSACYPTAANPCYGPYKATIGANTINSVGGTTVNQHIQIPASYLKPGVNTIVVKGYCGNTVCNLSSTIITVQ